MYEGFYTLVDRAIKRGDRIHEEFETNMQHAQANYAGQLFADKQKEILNRYDNSLQALIDKARADLDALYETVKERLKARFSFKASGDIPSMDMLRAIDLTKNEVEALVEQYRGNYPARNSILKAAQEKGIETDGIPTLDAAYKNLDDIRAYSWNIIEGIKTNNDAVIGISLPYLEYEIANGENLLNGKALPQ